MKRILTKVKQVARTDATVLLLGETGTGKGLIARALHNESRRRDRPLMEVNCAALSTSLIESELFGHEKGAFTGAASKRIGRFESAHGTSLFLDEVGELPLGLQAKLLRVLQDGEFERVGGSATIKTDVRIIAATNRNLEEEVKAGDFARTSGIASIFFPSIFRLSANGWRTSLFRKLLCRQVRKMDRQEVRRCPAENNPCSGTIQLARKHPGIGEPDRKGGYHEFRRQSSD